MGTLVQCRTVERGHSTISKAMRLGMGKDMWARPAIARRMSIVQELRAVHVAAVVTAAVGGTNEQE